MRPIGIEAAVDGVADITKRTSELSHTLFDIARRLPVDRNSDPTVPHAIRDIAREFADIAQTCTELCSVSDDKKIFEFRDHVDLGRTLGRLDLLVEEFELQLAGFTVDRVRRWFANIFRGNVSDLITKCQSIKEPLRLHLSVLRIANLHESRNELSDEDVQKKKYFAWMIVQEVYCAESWVETSRQVIKILMNTERRLSRRRDAEKLEFQRWTESPGATAGWMYNLVFDKALTPKQQHTSRGGMESGTRTKDDNGSGLDKEYENGFKPLPDDIEITLDVGNPRMEVIDELLRRWAGQNFHDIRRIADTSDRGRSRYQDSSQRIAKWHLDNEGNSSRRERSSTPRRDRTQPLNFDTNPKASPPPRVPTPPTLPAKSETAAPTTKPDDKQSTPSERKPKTKVPVDTSMAFTFGELRTPSVSVLESESDDRSESISESALSSDPGSIKEKKKRRISGQSLSSSNDTIVPLQTQDPSKKKADADEHVKRTANAEQSSKRTESSRQSVSETGIRRTQSTTKGHGQQTAPKVGFADMDDASQRQRKRAAPSQDTASERRSRDRNSSIRESSSHRSEPLPSRVVTGDGSATRSATRHSLPNPRQSAVYSERGSTYGASGQFPAPIQRQMSLPPSGMMNPYPPPRPPSLPIMHPFGNYQDRGNVSDEGKSSGLTELQKQIDSLKRDAKARKEADETARLQVLKGAEEAANHRELLRKKDSEVEDLKKSIRELKDSARREVEEIQERERTSTRQVAIIQAKLDEQTQLQIKNTELRMKEQKQDLERHREVLKELEQSNNKKLQECEDEKKRYAEYYNDQLARKIQEIKEERKKTSEEIQEYYETLLQAKQDMQNRIKACEEEQKENSEDTRKYYIEQFKTEQNKHRGELADAERKAEILRARGDAYLKRYNELARMSRHKGPAAVKVVPKKPNNTSKGPLDPFRYQETEESPQEATPDFLDDVSVNSTTTITSYDDQSTDWTSERMVQNRNRGSSVSCTSTERSEDSLKVILFPPCAGRSDLGYKQLGNYLTISGFKAMFEEKESAGYNNARSRERTTLGSNVLRGTLFWQPPAATAEADLYKSLRNSGWKPTYLRRTDSGQTWFYGSQPVHAQFFSDMYKPQLGESQGRRAQANSEEESLIISKDIVEVQELDSLGHFYEETEHEIFLAANLTSEDIDHIVARSFLAREGRLRKKFRANQSRKVPTRGEIKEVESEAGDDISETSSEATVVTETTESKSSTWSLWAPWSR